MHKLNDCECKVTCKCYNILASKCLKRKSHYVIATAHNEYPKYLKMKLDHIHKLEYEGIVKLIELHKSVCLFVQGTFIPNYNEIHVIQ